MKNLLITIFMISMALCLQGQSNYNVIKVNGTIVVNSNNSVLERGSSFADDDELQFKTSNARAAVIHPNKGRFILMPNNNNVAYARANLTPSMSNISTRSGAILNKVDLQNHFCDDFVIIDKTFIKISPAIFKMDDDNFFYIKYRYQDEDIHKKLGFANDTLIIDKSELFTIDGWPITNPNITELELLYMNKEKGGSMHINSFNPVFPDANELKSEVEIIIQNLGEASEDKIVEQVTNYINEMYGKINKSNVETWLRSNKII